MDRTLIILAALLFAAAGLALGCGGSAQKPPPADDTVGEQSAPEQPGREADGAAPSPEAAGHAEATEPTGSDTTPEALEARKAELVQRERELAEREARVARREADLAPQDESAQPTRPSQPREPAEPATTAARAPAGAAGSASVEEAPAEVEPAARTGQADEESWRLSRHRTDRAAREGYEPATGAPDAVTTEGGFEPSEPDEWAEEPETEPTITWETRLLPSGTMFTVELETALASDTARAGDTFRARVTEDVLRGGEIVIPAGASVVGRVLDAKPLNERIGGRARLDLAFERLEIPGAPDVLSDAGSVAIQADFALKGRSETARDAAAIGGGAVGGAILGRVLDRDDKDKASALGALIGAAAGAVIASRTEGEEVVLPEGAQIELALTRPAEVPVRSSPGAPFEP
jgi:hypothetical protein